MPTKSRPTMPMYAEQRGIRLTRSQLHSICKGRVPRWANESAEPIIVAKTKDGVYWGKWSGSTVFWASRWYRLPSTVGRRAEAIDQFVKGI